MVLPAVVLMSLVAASITACGPGRDQTATSPTAAPSPAARTAPTPSPARAGATRYVAVGASDTVGVGATDPRTGSWPAVLASRMPDTTYVNTGVSGSLTAQAAAQQLARAIEARPTLVTIWLAVNDINAGVTPTAYGEALGGLVSELVARTEARIFIGNVPDLRPVPIYRGVDPALLIATVTAYNQAIATEAARHPGRVTMVDLFEGSAELVTTATVAADGFHPSDEGYRIIAERFARAMKAAGVPLRD